MESDRKGLAEAEHHYNTKSLLFISFFSNFGGLLFGFDTSVISGASLYLYDDLGYGTDSVKQVGSTQTVVSVTLLGALVGSLL